MEPTETHSASKRRPIPGFTDYKIDIILKMGGSLLLSASELKKTIREVEYCAGSGKRIVVVPGGGPMDKAYEALASQWNLSILTSHKACALAQDQTGLILSDPAFSKIFQSCETIVEVIAALDNGKVAVILPSKFIFILDFVEKTWDVTSDGIAAWFVWLLCPKRFAILTNVDGIFRNGSTENPSELIPAITGPELQSMGHTSVDLCTAHFLAAHKIHCMVLNGLRSDYIKSWLISGTSRGTLISNAH